MNDSGKRNGILSGGNWIVDHVKIVDTFPAEETLASIWNQYRGTGGAPYNVLVNLAKLGAGFPLAGAGLVGDDENGNSIIDDCKKLGIDMSQVHITKAAPTSYTDVITVRSTGKRTFFHMRGANSLLKESHFNLAVSRARIFQLGYLLLLDALDTVSEDGTTGASRLLKQACELGFKTSVDVVSENSDRFVKIVTPTLPFVDYLIINEFEASKISGIDVCQAGAVNLARLSEAAQAIFTKGVREWVIIHFAQGALARNRAGAEAHIGSVRVPRDKVAGTAGAGDAFAAGCLYGLHDGRDIGDCLKMAACAAASTLFDPTCTGSIRPLQKCLELGAEFGFIT